MDSTPGIAPREGRGRMDTLFGCLAHRDRRRVLRTLLERPRDPQSERDLASSLARDGERESIVALHHVHVPKLAEADLVDVDSERGTVTLADHPALRDDGIVSVVEGERPEDPDSIDALFESLADPRRRAVLDVLSHQYGGIHTETLAREVGARELNVPESNLSDDQTEKLLTGLYHVHLPKLAEAGLVAYDVDERLVAYSGHPALRVPWMHSVLGPDFRASLTGEPEKNEVGTIEGREQVVSFGQSLCDAAEEELFCMFTASGLLEAGCFTRIRDAARRGVDVYLGTCDPTVREFVSESVPDVCLWEPGRNWLDFPVEDDRVGRLLLADREAVMLGTLGERSADDVYEEKAIVGEGEDNALVVMVRQMLASRLRLIDEERGDQVSQLPFR